MLGNSFPGYIKSEYTYDESGFIVPVDNKDDIVQQQLQQQSPATVTNSISSTNMTFQNNNNDWQMVDHNSIEQVHYTQRTQRKFAITMLFYLYSFVFLLYT